MQHNYRQIESRMASQLDFNGNSCHAVWDGNDYKIYSYSTLIAVGVSGGEIVYYDGRMYSQTTARLQSIIRRVYGIDEKNKRRVYYENDWI